MYQSLESCQSVNCYDHRLSTKGTDESFVKEIIKKFWNSYENSHVRPIFQR